MYVADERHRPNHKKRALTICHNRVAELQQNRLIRQERRRRQRTRQAARRDARRRHRPIRAVDRVRHQRRQHQRRHNRRRRRCQYLFMKDTVTS